MRVVCEVYIPKVDSFGRNHICSEAFPCKESAAEIKCGIFDWISRMNNFKPGMRLQIDIKEDWDESQI